eukprot:TRINITY_DN80842_c0_g1_i1.p1 TRINITY_DN80842_c0_g1~~TRINITY_DN80842_c0_g1_i1.p1  ORF type:complete len:157 (-),score=45.05 TRINITY_DN80842_c0_g1_i1:432-902(-)
MEDKKIIVEENESEEMPPPPPPSSQEKAEIEKMEEQKLKSKFPGMPNRPMGGGGGHSAFLQKRLAKGQKYFDSGDYQMAKQKGRVGSGRMAMPVLAQPPTGEEHPTPDTVPARKTSIIQPVHDHSQALHLGEGAHQPPAVLPGQPLPNPAIAKLST